MHQRNEPIQYKAGTQAQIGSPEKIAKEIEERKASESTVDPSQTGPEQGQHLDLSPSPQTYGASAIALSPSDQHAEWQRLQPLWKNEGSSYRPSYSHNYSLEPQTRIDAAKNLWPGEQPIHKHGQNHTRLSSKKILIAEPEHNYPLEALVLPQQERTHPP